MLRTPRLNQSNYRSFEEKANEVECTSGGLPSPLPGKQTDFYNSDADICLFGGSAGSGKLQCSGIYRYRQEFFREHGFYCNIKDIPEEIIAVETKILTSYSWKFLSDIKPGDYIMNPDGSPQRVIKVFENGVKPLYRVTFEDGTSTLAGAEHLWSFWIPRENSRSKVKIKEYGRGQPRPIYNEWNCNYALRARVGTTAELKERIDRGIKILTPICAPMRFARGIGKGKFMNPYLLGVILGDGLLTNPQTNILRFCKSLEDSAIAERLTIEGLNVVLSEVDYPDARNQRTKPFAYWNVLESEAFEAVKSYGLLYKSSWEKFIPPWYLWASKETRMALAQGLMDTDGYANGDRSGVEYSTTSPQLAEDAVHLFRSLGYIVKSKYIEQPRYKKKDGSHGSGRPAWRIFIQGNNLQDLFYLPRKKENCKPFNGGVSWAGKHIISIEYERDEYARCLQVAHPNRLYVTDDFIVTHNSVSLLLDLAKPEYLANPAYNAVVFRRSYADIKNPGGILDESTNLYYAIDGQLGLNPLEWKFSSKAKIAFGQLQHEKTVYEFQGAQITRIAFDELVHFTEKQFFYMLSRNRSTSGIKPQIRATCNPDADSWVKKLIEWYLDEAGYPIPERSGVLRWFVRINSELIWSDTKDELIDRYPELIPKSFSFIPATIYDNKILLEKDPGYLANLMALHPVEKARLLGGNWKERFETGKVFDRTWFEVVDTAPSGGRDIRFWDLAATAQEVAKSTSFYTAGVRIKKVGDIYYIIDALAEQKKAGDVEDLILKTALIDGNAVKVRWEKEGGSAGNMVENSLKNYLHKHNPSLDVAAVKPLGDKLTRAIPVASAASNGKIKLGRGTWNLPFLNAISQFDGSSQPLVNDWVDAMSGAFSSLEEYVEYDMSDMFS